MPYFCAEKIERALNDAGKPVRGSRILIVGVSYKPGVADLRGSPALKIMQLLGERGAELAYHDPHVPELSEFALCSEDLGQGPGRCRSRGHGDRAPRPRPWVSCADCAPGGRPPWRHPRARARQRRAALTQP